MSVVFLVNLTHLTLAIIFHHPRLTFGIHRSHSHSCHMTEIHHMESVSFETTLDTIWRISLIIKLTIGILILKKQNPLSAYWPGSVHWMFAVIGP